MELIKYPRYVIDVTRNGYILSVKVLPNDSFIDKMVFTSLGDIFDELDSREANEGRNQ